MMGKRKAFFIIFSVAVFTIFISHAAAQENDSAAPPNLQLLLDEMCETFHIPGMSAALFYDGKLRQTAASGMVNSETQEPVTIKSTFQIGSISKPVTAALAYILSEKGILPLETRILDVFPELIGRARPEYSVVDIRMLLSHTSGMPYQPSTEPEDAYLSSVGSDVGSRRYEYTKASLRDDPQGVPGEVYEYGGGTIILAAMMERITGKSWEELAEEFIFKPLGLESAKPVSGWGGGDSRAWGHYIMNGRMKPLLFNQEMAVVHGPAGTVEMSAPDLIRFARAHFYNDPERPPLLTRTSLTDMQKKVSSTAPSPGWFVEWEAWSDYKTVWHSGDTGQARALLVFSPKYECAYVIYANISNEDAGTAIDHIQSRIKSFFQKHFLAGRPALILPAAPYLPVAVSASNTFYNMEEYNPAKAVDGILTTRWATDGDQMNAWIELDLGSPQPVAAVLIREEFSPRISDFIVSVKTRSGDPFTLIAEGGTVGDELVLQFPELRARYIRLEVTAEEQGGPTISEFQVFDSMPY